MMRENVEWVGYLEDLEGLTLGTGVLRGKLHYILYLISLLSPLLPSLSPFN